MQNGMLCLDAYALVEIANGNENYKTVYSDEFVIPSPVLAEFFFTMMRHVGQKEAEKQVNLFRAYAIDVSLDLWLAACRFRFEHKSENLSFFDCIGYVFAQDNNLRFVTGDKAFRNKKGVLFVK